MQSLLGNTRKTDLVLHAGGCIEISARASRALRLKRGDVIDIVTDGAEMYLYVRLHAPTVGRHEAAVFPSHKGSHHFRTYSRRLYMAVAKAVRALPGKLELVAGEAEETDVAGTALPLIHMHTKNSGQ